MYFKKSHEDFIIVGDFNSIINENATKDICIIYNFKNSTNHPTCFNNLENPSCIGLILTNKPIFSKYTCFLVNQIRNQNYSTIEIINLSAMKLNTSGGTINLLILHLMNF